MVGGARGSPGVVVLSHVEGAPDLEPVYVTIHHHLMEANPARVPAARMANV